MSGDRHKERTNDKGERVVERMVTRQCSGRKRREYLGELRGE